MATFADAIEAFSNSSIEGQRSHDVDADLDELLHLICADYPDFPSGPEETPLPQKAEEFLNSYWEKYPQLFSICKRRNHLDNDAGRKLGK